MKTLSLFCLLVASFLTGCATPNTMMVHPANGEFRNCAASGWGWVGAPLAVMTHDSCVENLRSIGFVPVKEVEPSILIIDSDPQYAEIYAGSSKDVLKYVGSTPFSITHPPGSRLWIKECYQVKKAGYRNSEIQCFDTIWGDRNVFFKLKKNTE